MGWARLIFSRGTTSRSSGKVNIKLVRPQEPARPGSDIKSSEQPGLTNLMPSLRTRSYRDRFQRRPKLYVCCRQGNRACCLARTQKQWPVWKHQASMRPAGSEFRQARSRPRQGRVCHELRHVPISIRHAWRQQHQAEPISIGPVSLCQFPEYVPASLHHLAGRLHGLPKLRVEWSDPKAVSLLR